jgi:hypothetical protein
MISAPILARREPMPTAPKKSFAQAPLRAAIFGFTFVLVLSRFPHLNRILFPHGSYEVVWDLVSAFVTVVAIHELGHAIAGLVTGFEFISLRAWPLTITSVDGRIRIALSFARIQNQTHMIPRRFENHRRDMLVLSSGGVTANFATAAIVLASLHAAPNLASSYVCWLGIISAMIGAGNCIPNRSGALSSDGAVFSDAFSANARFDRATAFMRMARAYRDGTSARDFDPAYIADALALSDGSRIELLAHVMAYAHFVGRDRGAAEAHLESALALAAKALPSDRAILATECAVFAGYDFADEPLAQAWSKSLGAATLGPNDRLRIDASLAWASGDRDAAIATLERLIADPAIARLWYRDAFVADCRRWLGEMTAVAVAVPSSIARKVACRAER